MFKKNVESILSLIVCITLPIGFIVSIFNNGAQGILYQIASYIEIFVVPVAIVVLFVKYYENNRKKFNVLCGVFVLMALAANVASLLSGIYSLYIFERLFSIMFYVFLLINIGKSTSNIPLLIGGILQIVNFSYITSITENEVLYIMQSFFASVGNISFVLFILIFFLSKDKDKTEYNCDYNTENQITALNEIYEKGIITDTEYQAMKTNIENIATNMTMK